MAQLGKKVLVTGGSSGIGSAIVKTLAGAGYRVTFTFHKSADQAQAICDELSDENKPVAMQCDLADEAAVDGLCSSLAGQDEPFYGLVHSAGTSYDAPVGAASISTARATMQVNFWSLFSLCSALVRGMTRHRSGRIVAISSVVAHRGARGNSIYAATKGAMESFLLNLVLEVAQKNVTVNCLAPGYIDTPLMKPYAHAEDVVKARIPAGTYGSPEKIAPLVAFLLSDDASYINGARIAVDGGLNASLGLAIARKP